MFANNSGRGPSGGSKAVLAKVPAPPVQRALSAPPSHTDVTSSGASYGAARANAVSPARVKTNALAQKIAAAPKRAGTAPQSLSNRMTRANAIQSRFAAADPFAPIANSDLLSSRGLRQMMFQGQFNQDFQALKGQRLIPQTAKEPPLTFPLRGLGQQGDLSFETGNAVKGNALVHISPSVLFQATQNAGFVPSQAWARETPIHELAHALQKPSVLKNKPLREGGAQAFADNAAVRTVGPLAINDTNYSGYVQNARRLGPQFYTRGQFATPSAQRSTRRK